MDTGALSISYRKGFGLWWPDYDVNADGVHAYLKKRISDAEVGLKWAAGRRVCVQAGGHVGMWANRLAKHFVSVITFEPDPFCRAALEKNAKPGVSVRQEALSDKDGDDVLSLRGHSGSSQIVPDGHVEKPGDDWKAIRSTVGIRCVRLDSLRLTSLDLMVLDIEGHELAALEGAKESIRMFRPVIVLEVWKDQKKRINDYMDSIGYRKVAKSHNDVVWTSR